LPKHHLWRFKFTFEIAMFRPLKGLRRLFVGAGITSFSKNFQQGASVVRAYRSHGSPGFVRSAARWSITVEQPWPTRRPVIAALAAKNLASKNVVSKKMNIGPSDVSFPIWPTPSPTHVPFVVSGIDNEGRLQAALPK
jgi:hypothetical protein